MSDPTDIVERLRKNAVFNYRDTYIEAANEIERLRKERDEARKDRAAYRIEIDRLILQRNDARLNVLDLLHPDARDRYADARGWFFHNENKP